MAIHFGNLLPAWLALTIAAALLAAILHGIITLLRKQVNPRLVTVLAIARLTIFCVFILILFQPVLSFTGERRPLPEMAVLVDISRSMSQPGQSGGATRLHDVLRQLKEGELARALEQRFALSWFTFAGKASAITPDQLGRLEADGATTQIGAGIESALEHQSALGKRPQRLLLVSDGQDHGAIDPAQVAAKLGVAIDVLAPTAADVRQSAELEITNVQAARRVLLGSETHFRVSVTGKQSTQTDRSYTLIGAENGKKVLEQDLLLKAGTVEQTLTLVHRPTVSGIVSYDFLIAAASEKARPKGVSVQVLDKKFEVLILEDTWRWEYKFLHRLFEDDPSFRFTALLPRGGKAFVQFGSPDRRVNLVGVPQNRADLENFDIFVLGDVNPTRWTRGLAAALAQLITEEGKSLVVIAGPNLPNLAEFPELHALLPVELARESGAPVEGAIDVRIRPESSASPFFFQVPVGDVDKLPPLDNVYPVVRKRPGASILLEAAKQRNSYGNLIVMAEQTIGRGRVLYVGADTLWKWQTLSAVKEGPTPYSIFWQQAFRALTPSRSTLGPVNIWLTADRTRSEVGRPIRVQAEVQAERPPPAAGFQAFVKLSDEKRLPLLFAPDAANPRLFHAEFTPTEKGALEISAKIVSQGNTLAEGTAALRVDEPSDELGDRDVDLAGLSRLAAATGGKLIDPIHAETWPETSDATLPMIEQQHTTDLWNNFTLLLLLCALLAWDWLLRVFKGLV